MLIEVFQITINRIQKNKNLKGNLSYSHDTDSRAPMALHRCVHQQTSKLTLTRSLSSFIVASRPSASHRTSLKHCKIDPPANQINRFNRSNSSFNQVLNQTFRRTISSSPAKVNSKPNEMSSPESDQQLTSEQIDERFLKTPARLLLRKPENENDVYVKLQYKVKLLHSDKY